MFVEFYWWKRKYFLQKREEGRGLDICLGEYEGLAHGKGFRLILPGPGCEAWPMHGYSET